MKTLQKKHTPVEISGIRWFVAPEAEARFRRWAEANWPEVLSRPQTWLKRDRRCNTCVSDGLVVKTYRLPEGRLGRLHRLKPPKAAKAFYTALHLREKGVPLAAPVAWSNDPRLGEGVHSALVIEHIGNARPLAGALGNRPPPPCELFERLGALLGAFHAHNFCNRDYKDTNILLTSGPESDLLPLAIDLDGTRRMTPGLPGINRFRIRRDFMPLLHSLAVHGWDRPEIRRKLAKGWTSAAGRPLDPHRLPRVVTRTRAPFEGWSSIKVRLNRSVLLRQILTIHAPTPHAEWLLYAHRFWKDRLSDLDFVSASRTAIVSRGARPEASGTYYFKRIRARSWLDTLKHFARPLPALRACRAARLLTNAGLATPEIMAVIEYRVGGLPLASGIITQAAENAEPLDRLLSEGHFDAYPREIRRRLLRKIGATVGQLHQAGLVHGDLRLGNVLCRMNAEYDTMELVFIDNERTRPCRRCHERARNLVQLNMLPPAVLPVRDRLRCWRAYRKTRALDARTAQRLREQVVAWTRKRWRERGWLDG